MFSSPDFWVGGDGSDTAANDNFFFRTKMLMLALAGINMLVFELTAGIHSSMG